MVIKVPINNFSEDKLKCPCCGRLNHDEGFLIRLQAFRFLLDSPFQETSGGRCLKHNKEVGGVDTSCHQNETKKATALDGYPTRKTLINTFKLAIACGLFNEVILYLDKHFIHLAYDKKQGKKKYYAITTKQGTEVISK